MALLTLPNTHKTFERGTVNENHVLRSLNLDIKQGDFVSVIGGNSAEKSVLMSSIAGVIDIDERNILLEGESIRKAPVVARSKDISRVFQDPRVGAATDLTVEESIAITYRRGKRRSFFEKSVTERERGLFREALAGLGLGLENRMKTDAAFLSEGQRQALTLTMAASVHPKILLLDEHTVALSPKISDMVTHLTGKTIEEQKLTTLVITHNMEHAIEYGNHLIMLYHGKIMVGVRGDEGKNLIVAQLIDLLHKNSGQTLDNDALVLGRYRLTE